MLTDDDVDKIQKTLDPRFSSIEGGMREIKGDIKGLREDVSIIRKDTCAIKLDVSNLKEDVGKIRKDTDAMLNFFDREYLNLRARVERIEEKLGITHLE